MNIFIVGGGAIGRTLAGQLVKDGYKLTVIDRNPDVAGRLGNTMDILCYTGNGASYSTLEELGAGEADILSQ